MRHSSVGFSAGFVGVVLHTSVAYPGGGPGCSNTPLSVHFINYSLESVNDSTYDSLHDTAQLAPAPSEKTITGAASSRYMHYETELAEHRVYYYTRV